MNNGIIPHTFYLVVILLMAMRPEVRRRAIIIMVFAVVQWLFMRYIVDNQLFNLTTHNRILFFSISSLGGALLIFVGLIYMVLKGNAEKE